jgi:TolB-like protein/class 3 adenylate cyclase
MNVWPDLAEFSRRIQQSLASFGYGPAGHEPIISAIFDRILPGTSGCILSSARVDRRLAAILAADVVGSCRLMGSDEEGALARLKDLRRTLVDPKIAEHQGRLVKNTGDGVLVEFASAVDAVRCADEIQRDMAARNADVPQDERIVLRIGVHVGDIMIDENDIFGDAVNIAVRLEGIAEPGGVCISEDAQRQIRAKVGLIFDDMGEQYLKNITEPIRTWRLSVGDSRRATAELGQAHPALSFADQPSIAVLPFQNISGDPEQEYFADGMVEDITTALSRIPSLIVIARNSSFTYKGKAVDIKRVGRELGVRYALEGSVRKSGGRLRITGQLNDTESGAHVWAERFDGQLQDVFELQDQITERVVGALESELQSAEIKRKRRSTIRNLSAYDHFLRGISLFYELNKASNEKALGHFYEAVRMDPPYATPYAYGAMTLILKMAQGWVDNEQNVASECLRLAGEAIARGHDDSVALSWAGFARIYLGHDLEVSAELVDRSLSLNPNSAIGWYASGLARISLGDPNSAMRRFDRAALLNPKDPAGYGYFTSYALAAFLCNRLNDALRLSDKALVSQPNFLPALRVKAASLAMLEQADKAALTVEKIKLIDPHARLENVGERMIRLTRPHFELYCEGLRKAGY